LIFDDTAASMLRDARDIILRHAQPPLSTRRGTRR
jgi:hypothetical protein